MHPLEITVVLVSFSFWGIWCQYHWQRPDSFDEIKKSMDLVNAENCQVRQKHELYLRKDSISHVYDIKEINPIFPNRTALRNLYNVALTRGYFYSFIFGRAVGQPGLMYYYLSAIADIAANPSINASAIYFDNNCSYPNWYRNYFNRTLALFAPRAIRSDDFNDPLNPNKVSTLNTLEVTDLGVVHSITTNYTNDMYKINDWFSYWLPDNDISDYRKTVYAARISHANGTVENFEFFGPPGPAEIPGPVSWTQPYFDCGRSNKWIVSVTVPIPDLYPRNSEWRHLQKNKYVAVAVADMNFIEIDINQCPLGKGNPGPNLFANTAKCKYETTECEPLHGWGFRRGGYMCRCKPGYRYPHYQRGPFLGEIIERATKEEHENGFDCEPIGRIQFVTILVDPSERINIVKRSEDDEDNHHHDEHIRKKRYVFGKQDPLLDAFNKLNIITRYNCGQFKPEDLLMNGDVAYGKEQQFEYEARTALRLANFLSVYLQKVDPDEFFTDRYADKDLNEYMVHGEVLANVMGNMRLVNSGVYFDYNKFPNKTLFGPTAFRLVERTVTPHAKGETSFSVNDSAAVTGKDAYVNKDWFKELKTRWGPDPQERLTKYIARMKIRGNTAGFYTTKFDHYPEIYYAPVLEDGYWTQPYFDCNGVSPLWLVTYAAPFFGMDKLRSKNSVEFRGVVTVTMPVTLLDINQCTAPSYTANAFKNTDRCDYKTTECVPVMGRGFETGGYKCECIQGYEYPFNNPIIYFDGQLMELEWVKMQKMGVNKFDSLKCRIAGASCINMSFITVFSILIMLFYL